MRTMAHCFVNESGNNSQLLMCHSHFSSCEARALCSGFAFASSGKLHQYSRVVCRIGTLHMFQIHKRFIAREIITREIIHFRFLVE